MNKKPNNIQPPQWAARLLVWFAGQAQIEDLQGDMEEIFYRDVEAKSLFKARINYCKQVIGLLFSYALKKRQQDQSFHPLSAFTFSNSGMIQNYFKVAIRSLSRNRFFTFINVLGLAFGMSVTILFIGFMSSVLTYDKFHANYESIYRIASTVDNNILIENYASTPASIGEELNGLLEEKEATAKVNTWISGEATYKGKEIPMRGYFTEPSFFGLFSFEMLKGNPTTALSQPYQIILTSSAAYKLFSGTEPIGEIISFGEMGEYIVTGIVADPPRGSHLNFEVLASYPTLAMLERNGKIRAITDEWSSFRDNYTYINLQNEKVAEVEAMLKQIGNEKYQHSEEMKASFHLQPMGDIVLTWEDYRNDFAPYFGGMTIYVFAAITLLILLPACFNYSNVSISRAINRAKEIGIRKVVGGYKQQIWYQFITETIIICLIALIGSIGIYLITIEQFVGLLAEGDSINFELTTTTVIAFVVFAVVTGVLAGIVPATYFSKINPVTALKGGTNLKLFGKTSFKKVLIVSQFTLSLFFILGVVVQFKQFRHSVNYDMGFNKQNLLDVELQGVDPELLRNEFSNQSKVTAISMSSHVLGAETFRSSYLHHKEDSIEIKQMFIDPNYIPNLGLTLIAGENFKSKTTHDEEVIIVNEAFIQHLQLNNPHDALGQIFVTPEDNEVRIIGVVKDFNYELLRSPIERFVLRQNPDHFKYANVRLNSEETFSTLLSFESKWKTLNPDRPFTAKFLDHEIEESYRRYTGIIEIFAYLGFLAISVSCLGLLGMVVYSTETRAKEVGVRKVMGASVRGLIYLLSKEYLVMMMIASAIAFPIGYVFYNVLLSQVQFFHITVGFGDILISLSILVAMGAATMASQTLKIALTNPADTLKCE